MKRNKFDQILNSVGIVIIFVIAFFAIGFYWYYTQVDKIDYFGVSTVVFPVSNISPLDGKYLINGDNFILSNGKAQKSLSSDVKVFINTSGVPVFGNLNDDKLTDAVFVVTYSLGNNVSYYIAAAIRNSYSYVSTNTVFLGDNIFQNNISIDNGFVVEKYYSNKDDLENGRNEKTVYLNVLDNSLVQVIK